MGLACWRSTSFWTGCKCRHRTLHQGGKVMFDITCFSEHLLEYGQGDPLKCFRSIRQYSLMCYCLICIVGGGGGNNILWRIKWSAVRYQIFPKSNAFRANLSDLVGYTPCPFLGFCVGLGSGLIWGFWVFLNGNLLTCSVGSWIGNFKNPQIPQVAGGSPCSPGSRRVSHCPQAAGGFTLLFLRAV